MRENSRPRAHGPLAELAPRQPPQTLTFAYCLSAFGVRPREGRGPASGSPVGTAPRGRWRPAARRPLGSAERDCVAARPPRGPGGACVRFARRPLAFPSESFGAGTSPRCAGRQAEEAAGRGAPGGAGPPAASLSGDPGRTRLPPPPPPPPPRRASRAAPRAGRGQLFPSSSTRGEGLSRLTAPPLRALPFHPSPVCTTPRQNTAASWLQIWSLLIYYLFSLS